MRGWASLIFFFVHCLAPVRGRAGVRVLCFFCVDVLEIGSFHLAFVKRVEQSDKMRRDSDVLDRRRRDSHKNHPCLALTTIPSCLDN